MREKKKYLVLTFRTTTEAMKAELYCTTHGVPGRMIPLPREISSGCGMCWRIPEGEFSLLDSCLPELDYEKIYSIEQ